MKTTLIVLIFLFYSSTFYSQPQKGNIGISVLVQNSQLDFLIPIFISDNFAVSPAVGISSISDQFTDISLGGIIRYYFSKNIVSPFIGGRFGALLLNPKDGESTTDLIFGPLFGGEYYFTKNFSVGIELQLNITKSDERSNRFNNPNGTNINTATAFFATIYF